MPAEGLLVIMLDIPSEIEDEFNDWYRGYVPRLLSVPGFLGGRRFRIVQGAPKYMTIYELKDMSVFTRREYRQISAASPDTDAQSKRMFQSFQNLIRGVYRHIVTLPDPEPTDISRAKTLALRGMDIDQKHEEEFNDWYTTEHIANISPLPGYVRVRRYKLDRSASTLLGDPPAYLALYEVDPNVPPAREAWQRAVNTPWSDRMRRFYISRIRNTYEVM